MTDVSDSTAELRAQPGRSWLERPWGRAFQIVSSLFSFATAYVLAYWVMSPSTRGPVMDAMGLVGTISMVVIGFQGLKDAGIGRTRDRQT